MEEIGVTVDINHVVIIHFSMAMAVALAHVLILIINKWHDSEEDADLEVKEGSKYDQKVVDISLGHVEPHEAE